jgi:CBS domain-containing protein
MILPPAELILVSRLAGPAPIIATEHPEEAKMNVSEAMHAKTLTAAPGDTVVEVARLMEKNDVGAIPVTEGKRLVGILTDRDIAVRAVAKGSDPEKMTAGDIMTEHVIFCKTHESVDDAVHLMEQKKVRRLPVLDEKDNLVGMLSLGDVAHATPRSMSGELLHAVADHHA